MDHRVVSEVLNSAGRKITLTEFCREVSRRLHRWVRREEALMYIRLHPSVADRIYVDKFA